MIFDTDPARIAVYAVVACLIGFLLVTRRRIPKGLRLPPGPPGKAVLGNVADMPTHHQWETFTRWAKKFGDIVYIEILRRPMVVVNTVEAAHELFEKKSSIYSDRFDFPMLIDLMGFGWNFSMLRYGEKWRRQRKTFNQNFNPTAAIAYFPIQTRHARDLLRRLHQSPNEFIQHFRHFSSAVIMEIMYGIEIMPANDPYVQIAEEAFSLASAAGIPGTFLVDTFPILKYVPEWVPGAGFRKKARVWRETITQMPVKPFMAVKQALSAGTARTSFVASELEALSDGDVCTEDEEAVRDIAATAYGAGADTTTTALSWFILAMALYPEVQRKAQSELDDVIGMNRLPVLEDRENLPYANALCKEIHRWHPAFPLGVAHGLMQDDVYGKYFIPKGSIVVGNAWAMLHDENVYGPNPDEFNPERFLRPGVKDPTAAFGFGRRVCPGRFMADNSVFIATSSMLKVFSISPARDEEGHEIPIEGSSTSGTISRPTPFLCSIKLRPGSAERLVLKDSDE